MRVLGLSTLVLLFVGACDRPAPREAQPKSASAPSWDSLEPWSDDWILAHAPAYLHDDDARRAGLEASLTNPENLYSRTRLGTYGLGRSGWDALPEWNPRAAPMTAQRADAWRAAEPQPALEPVWNGETPSTWEAWRALGERVFFEYPLRSEPFWEVALENPERGEALGVERGPDGSVPGVVVLRDTDGETKLGITCGLCHGARLPGSDVIVAGRARRKLDYGALRLAYFDAHDREVDPETRARWESWGPGRADVLEDIVRTPIAIPDLYGIRHERLLTQAGTIRHDSPFALLVRQETQYIQANHHHTRPPRVLVFALAIYLYALQPPPARATAATPDSLARGSEVFTRQCARCHSNDAYAGDRLVDTAVVGTDDELATGGARGTGGYRPSPLIRVADAAPYLHHGVVGSLPSLLRPERLADDYTDGPAGPGAVLGHRFGHSLDDPDRLALIAFVETL